MTGAGMFVIMLIAILAIPYRHDHQTVEDFIIIIQKIQTGIGFFAPSYDIITYIQLRILL
jgi:hypothetical protein